jgi:hypothetical protein
LRTVIDLLGHHHHYSLSWWCAGLGTIAPSVTATATVRRNFSDDCRDDHFLNRRGDMP